MSKVKLGSVTDSCLGKMLDAEKNKGSYQPYLANLNVRWGSFELDNLSQMRFEDCEQERYGIRAGDLIMCEGGEPGRCAIWREELPNMKIQKALHRIRPHACLDVHYLYYWFLLAGRLGWLERHFTETTIKHLPGDRLKDIEIDMPSIAIQQGITDVLSTIDDKIAHNRRICAELESMAKTLYDYWFVQFDFPNAEGKPYRASGGEMVWNEQLKREIPKGWKVDSLYRIADFVNGLACQKYRPSEGEESLPVIKIKEMHDGISNDTELVSVDIPERNKIYDGDVLFSWSATLEVMYWFGGKGGLNQHIFKVLSKEPYAKEYVFEQLSAYVINFVKMAEARKTTMGHITTDHLNQSRIVLPPKQIIDAFTAIVRPIHEKIGQAQKENRELTQLRDWLLPMLMNGQATVAEESAAPRLEVIANDKPSADPRFERWLQTQGVAARGNVNKQTLHDIFDAMDDDDK